MCRAAVPEFGTIPAAATAAHHAPNISQTPPVQIIAMMHALL